MASIEAKIVLTGGPCGGKTTALSSIEENLTELGYKVIIVPEAATLLINGGIKCFGNNPLSNYKFQDTIIKLQMQNERLYEQAAREFSNDTKCVMVYDRGAMDGAAYIGKSEFNRLLNSNGLSRIHLTDNYDMVLHLVTAADGASEFYTLENNTARSEGIKEAIELDKKTLEAWENHSNLNIIDNSTDFDEKINKVINHTTGLLGYPLRTRKQRKYLVDINLLDKYFLDSVMPIDIEQSYITDNELEKRLRRRTSGGISTYYYTIQKQDRRGTATVYVHRRIEEREYYEMLYSCSNVNTITKVRYSFVYNKEQYRLDIFNDSRCILEANENSKLILPSGIKIIQDITNNEEYYNATMAKTVDKSKILLPRKLGFNY